MPWEALRECTPPAMRWTWLGGTAFRCHPGEPRTARFRSVVTLTLGGELHFFEGTLEGSIASVRSGSGGFGYDPVFLPDEYPGRSVAELPQEVKNAISHRGKALRAMAQWLKQNCNL